MIKQPDINILIRGMREMSTHGLPAPSFPDRNHSVVSWESDLDKEHSPGDLRSDTIFVNAAYDSRKTGINEGAYFPSAYRTYIGSGFFGFTCNQLKSQRHAHFAIQLLFNVESPFLLSLDDSEEVELFFFIIPPFIPHRMANPGGKLVSILVDPLSVLGRKLNALYEAPKSLTATNKSIANCIYAHIRERLAEFDTAVFFNETIACLNRSISKLPECRMDERIRNVITRCQKKDGENIVAGDLAGWTSLSESRARHLFKEETGVPFTQYIKWLRMMKAIKYACTSGINLTEAAHMAGFSDSAHLSRMFKEFFGLMPSSVLQ